MRHENIILPFRKDTPKLRRLHQVIERLASWCSWRCPLAALAMIIAGHLFSTPSWWWMLYDVVLAILIVLIFSSYGFTIAIGAIIVERPQRWFERVGLLFGVIAGLALVAIGLVGAWELLSSDILRL